MHYYSNELTVYILVSFFINLSRIFEGGGEKTPDKLFVKMEKEKIINEIHGTRRYFVEKNFS